MTEFLSALLGRATGRLPVLERRPRSLFEPLAGQPVAAPRGADGGDANEPEVEALSPPMSRIAALASASAVPAPGQPPSPPRATLLPPRSVPPIRPSDLPAAARTGQAVSARSEPPVTLRGLLQPAPAGRIDAPALPPSPTPARADAGPTGRRGAEATPATNAVAARLREPVRASAATLAALQAPRSGPALLLAQSRNAAASRRAAQGATMPPALVQISIGRVEIRAVQAPPDRPRHAGPAAPRLSLDAYLRSRNGAAR